MMQIPMGDLLADHMQHPRNEGQLPGATGRSILTNTMRGDALRLSVQLEGGRVVQARYQAFGNPVLRAVLSFLTECMVGQEVATAADIRAEELVHTLRIPPAHAYCAILAIDAMLRAFQDHQSRRGLSYPEVQS